MPCPKNARSARCRIMKLADNIGILNFAPSFEKIKRVTKRDVKTTENPAQSGMLRYLKHLELLDKK